MVNDVALGDALGHFRSTLISTVAIACALLNGKRVMASGEVCCVAVDFVQVLLQPSIGERSL